jgi:hydrogenase maturation protease
MNDDMTIPESASPAGRPTVLVIGVGNRFGRDDGIGPAVIDRVRQLCPHTATIEADGEAARLVEAWDDADLVVLVDAVRSGAPPGTAHRLVMERGASPGDLGAPASPTSSHAAGVAEAWALGAALDRIPGRLVVLGVEGADFGPGYRLSNEVARAVPRTARAVHDEIRAAAATAARRSRRRTGVT